MLSPYGLDIVESCLTCKMRADRIFCDLNTAALQAFDRIKYATSYPEGAVLFLEGQAPRGIFVLCTGQVKVCGHPYELTAETMEPCQVNFVKREDFLRFLKENTDACFKVAEQLSAKYNNTCHELRSFRTFTLGMRKAGQAAVGMGFPER
jgi:CRP/FNR family cyclic AMP-dependent transcriptional regulator